MIHDFKKNETVWTKDQKSHNWHINSPQKRLIYFTLYLPFINEDKVRLKMLDVGGGITSMTSLLAEMHDYTLVDNGIPPNPKHKYIGTFKHIYKDWYEYNSGETWDIIIANDIFPNVDQRLKLFLEKHISWNKNRLLHMQPLSC